MAGFVPRVAWNLSEDCFWEPALDVWLLRDPNRLRDCFLEEDSADYDMHGGGESSFLRNLVPHYVELRKAYLLSSVPLILQEAGVRVDEQQWADMLPEIEATLRQIVGKPPSPVVEAQPAEGDVAVVAASSSEPASEMSMWEAVRCMQEKNVALVDSKRKLCTANKGRNRAEQANEKLKEEVANLKRIVAAHGKQRGEHLLPSTGAEVVLKRCLGCIGSARVGVALSMDVAHTTVNRWEMKVDASMLVSSHRFHTRMQHDMAAPFLWPPSDGGGGVVVVQGGGA